MNLSDYILGLWRMGTWGNSPEENLTLVQQCIDLGIDTFDQANIYGWQPSCEELFGKALSLAPRVRDKMKIISKFNICAHDLPEGQVKHYKSSYKNVIDSLELSLARMKVEHLDVLLIHRQDYLMDADELAKAFIELKEQGKVLEFGVSNFSPSQLSLIQSRLPFPLITNQVELNPLRFSCVEDGTLDQCQEKRIRPMGWSPLAGGELFSANPSEQCLRVITVLEKIANEYSVNTDQVALAWVRRHPSNPHIILGSKNLKRIKAAVESKDLILTEEQWYRIWTASKGYEVP